MTESNRNRAKERNESVGIGNIRRDFSRINIGKTGCSSVVKIDVADTSEFSSHSGRVYTYHHAAGQLRWFGI